MTDPIQITPPPTSPFAVFAGPSLVRRHDWMLDAVEADPRPLPTGATVHHGGRLVATLMRRHGSRGSEAAWVLGGAR